jgi:hypothetical protein
LAGVCTVWLNPGGVFFKSPTKTKGFFNCAAP